MAEYMSFCKEMELDIQNSQTLLGKAFPALLEEYTEKELSDFTEYPQSLLIPYIKAEPPLEKPPLPTMAPLKNSGEGFFCLPPVEKTLSLPPLVICLSALHRVHSPLSPYAKAPVTSNGKDRHTLVCLS